MNYIDWFFIYFCIIRVSVMNRELFDKAKSSAKTSNVKRYENWYDDQYKPLRRKMILLETPDVHFFINSANPSSKYNI